MMSQNGKGDVVLPYPYPFLTTGRMESRFSAKGDIFKEALMRMIYLTHSARTGPRQPWNVIAKLMMGLAAAAALLVIALVGLIVVLPLALLSGLAMYAHLRRRLRTEKRKTDYDVIDAEYTIVERRD